MTELTRREREIALMVARGLDNLTIARRCFISPTSVENHLHNIYGKLGDRLDLSGKNRRVVLALEMSRELACLDAVV